jgi:hypothetical protein
MPSSIEPTKPNNLRKYLLPLQVITFVEDSFQDISNQMLETNFTLNLGTFDQNSTQSKIIFMVEIEV